MGATHTDRMPVYSIAVASELTGLPAATMRLYEEKGLLVPARTSGGTRRYSDHDVAMMRRVSALQGEGVNLAGVGWILRLQDENTALQDENSTLQGHNDTLRGRNDVLRGENEAFRRDATRHDAGRAG